MSNRIFFPLLMSILLVFLSAYEKSNSDSTLRQVQKFSKNYNTQTKTVIAEELIENILVIGNCNQFCLHKFELQTLYKLKLNINHLYSNQLLQSFLLMTDLPPPLLKQLIG